MTYSQMIETDDKQSLYEICLDDGHCLGCGTQDQIVEMITEGWLHCDASVLRMEVIS